MKGTPMQKKIENKIGVSSDAVLKATGKNWNEWFMFLDKSGCKKMNHKEIVTELHKRNHVGKWWEQMITAAYEQARGLRDKYEKPGGFEISASKTIEAPAAVLFKYWYDEKLRKKWLTDYKYNVRRSSIDKSIRITWIDEKSNLNLNFYPKGENKTSVVVQHAKLKSKKEAGEMKKYWKEQLERLFLFLSKQKKRLLI